MPCFFVKFLIEIENLYKNRVKYFLCSKMTERNKVTKNIDLIVYKCYTVFIFKRMIYQCFYGTRYRIENDCFEYNFYINNYKIMKL